MKNCLKFAGLAEFGSQNALDTILANQFQAPEQVPQQQLDQERRQTDLLNKVDTIAKPRLLPIIDGYRTQHPFAEIVPVSAKDGTNVDVLERLIIGLLPEGDPAYPLDYVTDKPEAFMIAEKSSRLRATKYAKVKRWVRPLKPQVFWRPSPSA